MTKLTFYLKFALSMLVIFSVYGLPANEVPYDEQPITPPIKYEDGDVNVPNSMVLYDLIEKYSKEHNVPRHIAYNIAFRETRYKGPFDWTYNPELTSTAGAVGPMQVMPSTAKSIQGKDISSEELRTNLELNVQTSMMLLEKLYNKYENWALVCGCYNTGQPIINGYAVYCSTNMNYRDNWEFYE